MSHWIRVVPLALSITLVTGCQSAPRTATAASDCPATTEEQNVAIARAWHESPFTRQDPAALGKVLSSELVHHAAGGYPKRMNAAGAIAMMNDFRTAFPDLRITNDQLIAKGDRVVQRYTATGTQRGKLGDLPASGRTATWTGINIFRIECGRIAEVWSEVDAVSRTRQLTGGAR